MAVVHRLFWDSSNFFGTAVNRSQAKCSRGCTVGVPCDIAATAAWVFLGKSSGYTQRGKIGFALKHHANLWPFKY